MRHLEVVFFATPEDMTDDEDPKESAVVARASDVFWSIPRILFLCPLPILHNSLCVFIDLHSISVIE